MVVVSETLSIWGYHFLFANRANAQMLSVPLPPERYQVKTGTIRGSYKKKNP